MAATARPKRRQRAGKHSWRAFTPPPCAWFPIRAAPGRRAARRPGYSGSAPMVVRIFHERAHLVPSARLGTTATPATSGRRNALGGTVALHQGRRRGDADLGEIDIGDRLEQILVGDVHDRMRFERRADALLRALDLERAGDDAAHDAHLAPFVGQLVVAPGGRHLGEQFEMHGLRVGAIARSPGFLRREAQHRREPHHRAAEQMVEHGQAGLARHRRIGIAIERVLADVEIEGREVRGHEGRERGEDALVVEIGVSLAHQFVELGQAGAASAAPAPASARA